MRIAAALVLGLVVAPALAEVPRLPDSAARTAARDGGAIAAGPAGPDGVPRLALSGVARTEAWRIAGDSTTAALAADLSAQLAAAGYRPVLDCDARTCGGFDFRYGLPVTPEPDMHVNLGDFRYLSAQDGDRAVGVLVSRGATALHVEITRIGPLPAGAVAAAAPEADPVAPAAPPARSGDVAARLLAEGHVALDDVVFETGAAALAGQAPSLAALAAFLAANPGARVALVGHTDAEGSLDANIALSRRRAEAVASALVGQHGVPAGQVTAEGAGWLSPRATNATPEGRALNRRVEAVLTVGP
jgi:OOP family OmpA-OmpF porin